MILRDFYLVEIPKFDCEGRTSGYHITSVTSTLDEARSEVDNLHNVKMECKSLEDQEFLNACKEAIIIYENKKIM